MTKRVGNAVSRRQGRRVGGRRAFASLSTLAAVASPATAQHKNRTPPPDREMRPDIVVIGKRGSAVTNLEPLATFDAGMIAATGATTIPELLRAIRGVTQSADGSEPIFLLNAQRVSGYAEIGALPPEAIERVEVLPEQAALKFGYSPTRRIVNFITKRRFRQLELRGALGTTTRSLRGAGQANVGLTRLHDDSRLTLNAEYRHTDPLLQSDRAIAPDPDIRFDSIGTVTGLGRGEIDPALSAAAGRVVTTASVPGAVADRATLAGFVAGAGAPRLFDIGPYRTLISRNDAVKGEAVFANRIGKTLAGSISLTAEQSRDHGLSGPATATLLVPVGAASPFSRPVLLDRYLTEARALRQSETTTTLHAGIALSGALSGWRWNLTAALDQKQIDGRSERGIDLTAANATIAAGAPPFAPLDPALLTNRITDLAMQRTRTATAKAVATNTPIRLPAGKVSVTATVEAERTGAVSETRGPDPFGLRLARSRVEGAVALDVPLASAREDFLPFLGELSLNASATARHVGGFGALYDTTLGTAWTPVGGVQLTATLKHSAAAPDVAQQSQPEVRATNVPVFDYGTGRTELATLVRSGNPGLLAERRLVQSLGVTIKPFAKRELRVSATYETAMIRNHTGTVYALTPQAEAILPELVTRDAAGRLVEVAFRPINFYRERQRTLNLTLNAYGMLGKPRAATPPAKGAAPPGPTYYGGFGPTIRFRDRLQLRPGTPDFDLLNGGTVTGAGAPRFAGYVYGGLNYLGNGMAFDGYLNGANRVRSADPAADLRFAALLRLNMSAFVSVHHFLPQAAWTKKLQFKVEASNLTDARQRVRDGYDRVPNRFQPDYLDPVGRTVTLSLRKLF